MKLRATTRPLGDIADYIPVLPYGVNANDVVAIYSQARYGTIPTPATITPRAPSTAEQMTDPTAWSPELSQWSGEDLQRANAEKISAAEKAGTYTPDGLTFTDVADFLSKFKWPLIVAGVGAAALVVALLLSRRP